MSQLVQITRWSARIVGVFLVGFFLLFLVAHAVDADGIPRLTLVEGSLMLCMLTSLAGMVVLWFREGLGGLMTLVGIGAFYAIDTVATGTMPGGWIFPLYFVPGVLSLIAWAASRNMRTTGIEEPTHSDNRQLGHA